ncbi:short-chain dehydrogenase [Pseudonocardia sp. TMWB2A]|uniref:SDR family oxidoreductase n=1 Tax=Pseudonocardia sp. TMWB2A TaxID=687430 RepID=UPI00307CD125
MSEASTRGTVLVTGASRGIGRAIAFALAKSGFDLILWARTEHDLASAAEQATELGARVTTALVDVADPAAVDRAGADSLSDVPILRAVIVNAGGGTWNAVDRISNEEWRSVVGPNLDGAFHTLRLTVPVLREVLGAQIIGIASDSSYYAYPTRSAYCASKAGFLALLNTTRREVRPHGVRVTAVVPSRVDSYFRGKRPGARPEALSIDEMGEIVVSLLTVPPRVEVQEITLASVTSTFGPYDELYSTLDNHG